MVDATSSSTTPAAAPAAANMFPAIGSVVESDDLLPTTMESLCMNCHQNGTTRLLFTQIPFFREIILMSFRCPHCGFANNEIQPGSAVQEQGVKYTLTVTSVDDLQRQIVKGDNATFRLEELDFEIPPGKGQLTTVEGLLSGALEQLRESQDERRQIDAQVAEQVDEFIGRLALIICGAMLPCHLTLDDPSGNSFVENPHAPKADANMSLKHYVRTREQQEKLGLQTEQYEFASEEEERQYKEQLEREQEKRREELAKSFHVKPGSTIPRESGKEHQEEDETMMEKEVFQIPTNCPNCGTEGTSKTCLTDIPFFREVIIMAFDCPNENCGYKTNEIKGGGEIPEKGKVIRLKVDAKDEADPQVWDQNMNRDVVKSNSAGITIPELEIEITQGSLGGLYTTVEGLLNLIKDSLFDGQAADFARGDSATPDVKKRFDELEDQFAKLLNGEISFTLEIRDPLACSYVYSPTAPEPEPCLTTEEYTRSYEEEDDLGLHDMCVENYDAPVHDSVKKQTFDLPSLDSGAFEGPFESFQGAKPGMVFRLGAHGLGYYKDVVAEALRKADAASRDAQAKMQNLQVGGSATHPNPSAVQD